MIAVLCSAPKMGAKAYIKALPSLLKKDNENRLYQQYVAEALRCMSQNTAKMSGGIYPKERFSDLLNPQKEDTRTEEEIIAQVKKAWREK